LEGPWDFTDGNEKSGEKKRVPFERWGDTFYTNREYKIFKHVIARILLRQPNRWGRKIK
jgi:hypothetical protein